MGVYKGAYSKDDRECNTGVGLDRDGYNPGRKPNKYVRNKQKADGTVEVHIQDYNGDTQHHGVGGFSGPVK